MPYVMGDVTGLLGEEIPAIRYGSINRSLAQMLGCCIFRLSSLRARGMRAMLMFGQGGFATKAT
ncbi:hypothetical protein EYZ11_012723 [Aspergillus tanneri]|uniref:Uncharacterized protein n=1 Tax=Aspergillus tanneri TaxID=1220188 RepID=A0A4S3IZH8_9EURO|nr:hypothetical protein EYZ11_012723 [Aspergillus tanneri]